MLKLDRAAHEMDMRLQRPMEWLQVFHRVALEPGAHHVHEWVLKQLEGLPGVSRVALVWFGGDPLGEMQVLGGPRDLPWAEEEILGGRPGTVAEMTPPRYDFQLGDEKFSLMSYVIDEQGGRLGKLEVEMRFDYLMEDVTRAGWWQSDEACLIDDRGRFLTHMGTMSRERKRLGETNDPLELAVLAAIGERPSGTLMGAARPPWPPERIVGFYRLHEAPWTILLFARGETILAPLVRFRDYYAIALAVCILSILVLIRLVAGRAVRSIKELSTAAEQIARGRYVNILPVGSSKDEIGQLTRSFNAMVDGLVERDFISNTFGRYMDPEIARDLLRRPEATKLGGEEREVAILMSDIRGFTPLSESLSPEAIINILNRYFSGMIEVIQRHRGIIVDFVGDSVLAFFDPLDGPIAPSVHRAIRCGLEMQGAMEGFNAHNRGEALPELKMGVGVHVGKVVVGNIGSETRAKYGIVGSPVNVTQRIQELANGGEVIVSEPVYQHAKADLVIKRIVETSLKGIQDRVTLYVVEGLRERPLH